MDADAGSLVRIMGGYGGTAEKESTVLITRDFLGGSSLSRAQELDLEMVVPSGYEKCLDLKSGKVYLQRCSPPNSATSSSSSSSSEHKHQTSQTVPKPQDVNFNPSSLKPLSNHFGGTSLDLKLFSSLASASPSCNYQSVCTLDKVKSALERTEGQSSRRKWSHSRSPASPSSSSIKETEESQPAELFAAGCPNCLLYVMISRSNPKCPKCHAIVPQPANTSYKSVAKRPRLDLNNISV